MLPKMILVEFPFGRWLAKRWRGFQSRPENWGGKGGEGGRNCHGMK